MGFHHHPIGVGALSVAALFALAGMAQAAPFVVTNLNDSGLGSLRQAVALADAAIGPDVVSFQAGLAGTILLTTGIININGDLTVNGPGVTVLAVSGNHISGVFAVASSFTVVIADLSIIDGTRNYGGGILSGGNLTVDRCLLSGNEGTVAFNGGGAICSLNAALTVKNSTFLNNRHALMGGGVYAANGATTLTNCTFVGNHVDAPAFGGGVANYSTSSALMHLVNCTFKDNLAATLGSQLLNYAATGTAVTDYVNTVFAGSTGVNISSSSAAGTATVTSLGHNISSDGSGLLVAAGDQPNTDPLLGALANNGGPTPTCNLLPGSPAIDAGTNSGVLATDQRGLPRIQDGDGNGGAVCDVGALELQTFYPLHLTNAVSRKSHNLQGPFDISLISSNVECRDAGPTLIIASFNQPIQRVTNTLADVSVSSGGVASLAVLGATLTINLSGVTNAQPLTVAFPGIKGAASPTSADTTCIPVLLGDVTGDRATNIFDLVNIRNVLNTLPTAVTFKADVNADGSINIFDLVVARNVLNQAVAACP